MANTFDWAGFTAFNGTLDPAFMTLNDGGDLASKILEFTNWIENVQRDPTGHGIPTAHETDIKSILATFFPLRTNPQQRVSFVRINSDNGSPLLQRSIAPVTVHFGPDNQEILIADGPGALGYVFSIVSPPEGVVPTWSNYYLPLAVAYSLCTYLAFVWPVEYGQKFIEGVPQMACVMYLPRLDGLETDFYFLGHTWSGESANIADAAAVSEQDRSALDLWRRQNVLDSAWENNSPTGVTQLNKFDPLFLDVAATTLWDYNICGSTDKDLPFLASAYNNAFFAGPPWRLAIDTDPKPDRKSADDFVAFTATQSCAELKLPPVQPIKIGRLHTRQALKEKLYVLLAALIQKKFTSPENPSTDTEWVELITFFLTPWMPTPAVAVPGVSVPVSASETYMPVSPTCTTSIVAQSVAFYVVKKDMLQLKLTALWLHCNKIYLSNPPKFEKEKQYLEIRSPSPWGRCAETYCTVCLLPYYCGDSLSPPPVKLPEIHGFSLQTPVIGQGFLDGKFQIAFSTTSLDQCSYPKKSVYRYPCKNCRVLLENYQLRNTTTLQADYDTDINVVEPKSVPVF